MKKTNRRRFGRVFSLFLAALLLLSVLPMAGLTASAASIKGAYFLDGTPPFAYLITGIRPGDAANTVKLYQNEDMQSYSGYSGVYEIPAQVYNLDDMRTYAVTEISGARGAAPGALQNVPLRGVSLPGTVTDIGTQAFGGCSYLTEIVFPTSVVFLAADAFMGAPIQNLTLDVVTDTTLLSSTEYTANNRAAPISLPQRVSALNVRSPLSVSGQVEIPGGTALAGSRIVVQSGAFLTLRGGLSGTGMVQVADNGTLTLQGSFDAFGGTFQLSGAASKLVNATSTPVTVTDASGKSVVVRPGETRTGGQKDEDPVDPGDMQPQVTFNYGGTVTTLEDGRVVLIVPYEGYHVESVVINGLPMGKLTRYEFAEASWQNRVAVTFAPGKAPVGPDKPVIDPSFRFSDVPADASYAEAVNFLVQNGIVQGVKNGRFLPGQKTTRGMFVSLLKRMENCGKDFTVRCKTPLVAVDVPVDSWYTESAAWAAGTGIVELQGEEFRADEAISRKELIMCLYRYTHLRGYDTYISQSNLYAHREILNLPMEERKAMAWALRRGYLTARGGTLDLSGTVTRAETAQILANYIAAY